MLQSDFHSKARKIDVLSWSVKRPKYRVLEDCSVETYVSVVAFGGSDSIPAGTLALLLGRFFDHGHGMGVTVLSAGGDECVDEGDRGSIRSPIGSRFDSGEKYLIAFARERGEIGVRDTHAIRALFARFPGAFDGLPKATAEADGDDEIPFPESSNEMQNASRRVRGKDRQSENAELVVEVFGEDGGEITGQNQDAARLVDAFDERSEARRVETVL